MISNENPKIYRYRPFFAAIILCKPKKYKTTHDKVALGENNLNSSHSEAAVLQNILVNKTNRSKSLEQHMEYFKSTITDLLVRFSDKMLFHSSSYQISYRTNEVIGKIAKIENNTKELEILGESHSDNVPIANEGMVDS